MSMENDFLRRERAKGLMEYYQCAKCMLYLLEKNGFSVDDITWENIMGAGIEDKEGSNQLISYLKSKSKEKELEKHKQEDAKQRFIKELKFDSPIKFLRFNPRFERWVQQTRARYKIDTTNLRIDRGKLFECKDESFIKQVQYFLCHGWPWWVSEQKKLDELKQYALKLIEWEIRKAPDLDGHISRIRQKRTKFPHKFDILFKNYILYNEELAYISLFAQGQKPSAGIIQDEDGDSYINIKVHANTRKKEIDDLWRKEIKNMQNNLRDATVPVISSEKAYSDIARQMIWYGLIEKNKSPKESNEILAGLGFKPVKHAKDGKKLKDRFFNKLFK